MNLLKSLQVLTEEPVTVKPAPDLWKESSGDVQSFTSNAVYRVRQIDDTDKYEVVYDDAGKRKKFAELSRQDLEDSFTQVRASQRPDAEGWTMYRDSEQVEAFKHSGETLMVDLGDGETERLNRGDYLQRQVDGDNFIYTVEQGRYFERDFTPK